MSIYSIFGFPGGSGGKASACNAGDQGLIPGLGRFPWRRKWQSTPVFLPGESRGQRSLAGYDPWGRKESDRQEYWSELPCPPPGDLSNPGIKPGSPALQADSLPAKLPRNLK